MFVNTGPGFHRLHCTTTFIPQGMIKSHNEREHNMVKK